MGNLLRSSLFGVALGLVLTSILTGCSVTRAIPLTVTTASAPGAPLEPPPAEPVPVTPTPVVPLPVPPPPINLAPPSAYHAYGDSITFGYDLSSPSLAYPSLIAADRQLTLSNYAFSGDQACDIPTRQIFPNSDNPAAGAFPIYTLMIGTNDQDKRAAGSYLTLFNLCHQASIAWLALPADLKILATAPGVITSGPGTVETANNWNAWETSAMNASIAFPIMLAAPEPIYIWVRMADSDPGAFSYAVDGAIVGTFTTAPFTYIATSNGTTDSLGLIRLATVPAGAHTITMTQTTATGTMRIVAVGAPPPAARSLPNVLVGDPPLEEIGSGAPSDASPSLRDSYVSAVRANVAIFAADGLKVIYSENHATMLGTANEMSNPLHPNALGQSELRYAFEAVMP